MYKILYMQKKSIISACLSRKTSMLIKKTINIKKVYNKKKISFF